MSEFTSKTADDYAREKGMLVRRPTSREVFLDIDSEEALAFYEAQLVRLNQAGRYTEIARTPSKTAGHWHIVVEAPRNITTAERLCLQSGLGSDRVRDILGFVRAENGLVDDASVFFELPGSPAPSAQGDGAGV